MVLALVAFVACPTHAQPNDAPAGGAAALDAFLDSVDSFSARFRQELWSADHDLLTTAAGELLLKRPNRFLWHYVEPHEQLVVADGVNLWMYDVELEQVTVAGLEEAGGASPALLLSGDAAVRDSFRVTADFVHEGIVWVKLEPRAGGSDFSAVLAGFRDGELRVLEFVDGLEQTTRIEMLEPVVNPELPDSRFSFEPPPGVDVLGAAH